MKYANIIHAFHSTPLAILPAKAEAIARFLRTKAAGADVDAEEIRAIVAAKRGASVQMAGRVAILPVFGLLSQRVGMMEQASGGISTEEIGYALDGLVADRQVRCIVMAFDSPGGSVFGVQELGDKIRGYRDQKKIVGIADPMAASAAYWLLAQTSEITVTPSGTVGSIGVFGMHEDASAFYEQLGVKTTLVSAGKYKVEGNEFGPLDEEARAAMQERINAYYGQFVAAVAKGRGVTENKVRNGFGQGRMVLAQDTVGEGMADKVGTMEQLLKRLGAYDGDSGTRAESDEHLIGWDKSRRNAAARARIAEAE